MTILDTIIEHKRMEVMKRKGRRSLEQIIARPLYKREPLRARDFFYRNDFNIIAEFKRKSPSKGILNQAIDPVPIVEAYKQEAAAVSILTDRNFFGGSFKDLESSKLRVDNIPLLRKDFIIDPYQVHEAKAYGADIILLIAAVLSRNETCELTQLATDLGLSVLLEVHNREESGHWIPGIDLVGVNNRDLKSFQTDVSRSLDMLPHLPEEAIKVSESGLHEPLEVKKLQEAGYHAFLMGEHFMATDDPGKALRDFVVSLKSG